MNGDQSLVSEYQSLVNGDQSLVNEYQTLINGDQSLVSQYQTLIHKFKTVLSIAGGFAGAGFDRFKAIAQLVGYSF
jgi:hypothetical protein